MGKYVIDETTLTGIGDAIREKEGTTAAIPVNNMKTRIQAIDTQEDLDEEMATQADLIAQIMTELEGKAAGGGSGEWEIFVNVPYTIGSGKNPGEDVVTVDVSGVDLSEKLCVLLIGSKCGHIVTLYRLSTSDAFSFSRANFPISTRSTFSDEQWEILTELSFSTGTFTIQAI